MQKTKGYEKNIFLCDFETELSARAIDMGYKIKYAKEISVFHDTIPDKMKYYKPSWIYHTTLSRMIITYKLFPTKHLLRGFVFTLAVTLFTSVKRCKTVGFFHFLKACAEFLTRINKIKRAPINEITYMQLSEGYIARNNFGRFKEIILKGYWLP